MRSYCAFFALALTPLVCGAGTAQTFIPPAPCLTCSSPNYIGRSSAVSVSECKVSCCVLTSPFCSLDGSLPISQVVPGKSFARIIQIWLENTDYNVAASSATFQKLAKQGITLSSYLALTQSVQMAHVDTRENSTAAWLY